MLAGQGPRALADMRSGGVDGGRFSVGHGVSEAQIERVLTLLPDLVARVRALGCAR